MPTVEPDHYIAAEVRAEMARQRKTLEGAMPILGMSKQAIGQKRLGRVPFTGAELVALAEWMDVPVGQFLPDGYEVVRVDTAVLVRADPVPVAS